MEELYKKLFEAGDYTKSFEEFVEQYGDAEKSEKLYKGLSEAGDYTKSFEEFNSQYGFAVKKKEDSEVTSQVEGTVSPTQQVVEESTSVESLPEGVTEFKGFSEEGKKAMQQSAEDAKTGMTPSQISSRDRMTAEAKAVSNYQDKIDKERDAELEAFRSSVSDGIYSGIIREKSFAEELEENKNLELDALGGYKFEAAPKPVLDPKDEFSQLRIDKWEAETPDWIKEGRAPVTYEEVQELRAAGGKWNGNENLLPKEEKKLGSSEQKFKLERSNEVSKKVQEKINTISKEEIEAKKAEIESLKAKVPEGYEGEIPLEFLQKASKDPFERAIITITPEMIDEKSEEATTSQLNKLFGQYGFYFEETGSGEAIVGKSQNGKEVYVDIDTWFSDNSEAEKLKGFLEENRVESEILRDRESKWFNMPTEKVQTIIDEKDLDERKRKINSSIEDFKNDYNRAEELTAELKTMDSSSSGFQEKSIELLGLVEKIKKSKPEIQSSKENLNRLTGEYLDFEKEKWDIKSLVAQSLGKGLLDTSAGVADFGLSVAGIFGADVSELRDKLYEGKEGRQKQLEWFGTTQDAINALKEDSFVGGALIGAIESLPSIAAGVGGTGALSASLRAGIAQGAMTFSSIEEEFRGMEGYADLTEAEKLAVKLPAAIISVALEKLSFENMFQNKGFLNKVITDSFNKIPKNADALMVKETLEKTAIEAIKTFSKQTGKASLGEFGTGASQEISDITIKKIYNNIKKSDVAMFKTPESLLEGTIQVLESGGQEMIGGFAMSTPGAVVSAVKGGKVMDLPDGIVDMFDKISKDDNFNSLFISSLKSKIANKEITKAEAQKQLDDYRELGSVMKEIPNDYTNDQKKEAIGLIKDKKAIEKSIEGISPDFVIPQKKELAEIAEKMKAISSKTDSEYATEKIQRLEAKKAELLEKNPKALEAPVRKGSDVTIGEVIDSEIEANKKIIDKPVTLKEKAVSLMDRAKGIFTKTEAPAQPEVAEVEQTTVEAPVQTEAEVQEEVVVEPKITAEVEAEVENEVFAEEVVYEMNKTNRKTWSKDFEIIDNRNGLELGPVEENGKWAVRNKVTGDMVTLQTKKDAQNIIANAPAYAEMFGDGTKVEADMLITPSTKTTTEVEAEVESEQVIEEESRDIESFFEEDSEGEIRFRMSKKDSKTNDADVDAIAEEMLELGDAEVDFKTPEMSTSKERNPLEVSTSIKVTEAEAKKSGFKSVKDMVKRIEFFNGIPMIFGISDMLAGGKVKDSKGKNMRVSGGLMFGLIHKGAAWAGVLPEASLKQYNEAVKAYKNNKSLFDKLWKEGKLPKGKVPMAIVRMGNGAVNSNEAVFRYLAPEVKSMPIKNQEAALEAIKSDTKLTKKAKDFIKNNNITNLGQFFDAIVDDATKRRDSKSKNEAKDKSSFTLTDRAAIYDVITYPEGSKMKRLKPYIEALYEGREVNHDLFLSDNIYKAIGEKAMLGTKKGDVVAIMGIDVLDGGVVEVGHENYGTGPKGGLIALISNPTNGLDVFPSWRAKAVRIFKKDKSGRMPSEINVAGWVMGDAAADKAMSGDKVSLETSPAELLAAKLRYAFPGVTVKSTKEEFNEAIKKEGVKTRESGGNIIYGFTKDGDVFLNPEAESLATPIHEFGHIWVDYLRSKSSGIKGSKLLERGLKLVEGTKELAEAIEIYGDNALAREEALVELMATKGVTIINAAQKAKFIEWLNGVFKYIKAKFTNTQELFKIEQIKEINRNTKKQIIEIKSSKNKQSQAEKEIAIEQVKKKAKEEIENVEKSINEKINKMSLDEFINTALADLFKGKDVDLKGKFDPSESTEAARARMRMDFNNSNKKMQTIINEARENNFTDAAIKDYLTRVRKFPLKEVNEAMKAKADFFIELPDSFKNMKGGIKAGQALFDKISKFRAKEVRNNKKRKNKISEQEIVDKTIEFMESQPEFIAEGDTYTVGSKKKGTQVTKTKKSPSSQQIEMLSDLQESVATTVEGRAGVRPTKNVQEKIRKARLMLTQRKKGARDVSSVKTELRNFIRKSLPKYLYTKKEALELIKKVSLATQDNIDNLFQEVTEFVTSKNNDALEKAIANILGGKYEKVESGRLKGVKIDLETKDRIDGIKSQLANKEMSPEEIMEDNDKLNERINEMQKNPTPTDAELNSMVDMQIVIEYNNSLLMDNRDMNKTASLDFVNNELSEIITKGRSALKQELQEAAQKYRDQRADLYEDITGERVDMDAENASETLDTARMKRRSDAQVEKVKNRARTAISKIFNFINDNVFGRAEALDGLMDKISKLPGELFGGKSQKIVTEKVDMSTRNFKERKMIVEAMIKTKLQDIYGKRWGKKSRNNRVKISTGIIDSFGNEMRMTPNEMAYMYNQYKDPANHPSFEATYGKDYARIMEEMENALDSDLKDFADWQVNEFFPELYEHYNDVYKKIYRANMPWNEFYAGRIYKEGVDVEPLDLLSGNGAYNTSVGAASTKARTKNNKVIIPMDITDALASYVNDMEYFAAYAETIRDIDKLFKNEYITSAINDIHGKQVMGLITDSIKKIANKGRTEGGGDKFFNAMNTVFITSRIALSPVIMIKQLTSLFTYANDIGYRNWVKYAAKNKLEQAKVWKEVRDNSVYLKDRKYDSILNTIEVYNETDTKGFIPHPAKNWAVNFLMFNTRKGDIGAIMLGGLPNYSYYKSEFKKKNPGATEQQAIDYAIIKFEKDTKRTQQSSDLQDRDWYQKQGAIWKALNMFQTSQKQYLRKEIQAVRSLSKKVSQWDKNAGKGTIKENIRTFLTYHVFMPVLFQYVASGLPGLLADWEEEDETDLMRAAIIGNLNALFAIGDVFNMFSDYVTGKPWAGNLSRSLGMLQMASGLTKKALKVDETKDKKKKEEALMDFWMEAAATTGLPAPTLNKIFKNYSNVGTDGSLEKDILRLLNYSEYVIDGKKKTRKSKGKMSMESLKKYVPDVYKEIQEIKKETKIDLD